MIGPEGFDWFLIVFAFLIDVSSWFGGRAYSRRRAGDSRRSAAPERWPGGAIVPRAIPAQPAEPGMQEERSMAGRPEPSPDRPANARASSRMPRKVLAEESEASSPVYVSDDRSSRGAASGCVAARGRWSAGVPLRRARGPHGPSSPSPPSRAAPLRPPSRPSVRQAAASRPPPEARRPFCTSAPGTSISRTGWVPPN